ncbi:MAG: carbohydrate kinase family protein [Anaerolineae bacterium]|nr:carbohydrate kinase family protein [Anaerolineae bacterium]
MDVVVTGSIAYDYLMRFPGSFREHILTEALHQVSLSFLVDEMTKHWGGVAANIAFTLGHFGLRPRLMGTVGRDFPDYRTWLEAAGVDCSSVRQLDQVFTASFFCNTDQENNQIASFYSGAMQHAREYALADMPGGLPRDSLVLVSPNDPQAMSNLTAECRRHGLRFVYDPGQQVARLDGDSLRRDMQGAHLMIVNDYEAHLVRDKTGLTMAEMRAALPVLVVTHGHEGSRIYTGGDEIHVPAFAPTTLHDPTGAGDAYRAGFVTGLVKNLPLALCGAMGALCATYVLEQVGTQSHRYTPAEFVARFRQVHDDGGALNALLS